MKRLAVAAAFCLLSTMLESQDNVLGIALPADVGYPFQDVTLFRPADSTQVDAAAILGKGKEPTVVAFWLTTCMPCQRELTAYTQLYPEWKKQAKFRLVAISTDFPQRFRRIEEIARQIGFPFEAYWDGHRRFRELLPGGLNGLPQVFLFDRDGQLVWHHKRYRPGDEQLLFDQILALQKHK